MKRFFSTAFRRGPLLAAAIAAAAFVPAPAFAGGGRHYDRPYYRHYDYGRYDRYRHHGYYDYRRHRRGGHISGGEAALIAAGIIGGVILIDRALDNRDERNDRYYDDRYRRGAFDDGYYYQRDDRSYGGYSDRGYDRGYEEGYERAVEERDADLDDRLLGDGDDARLGPSYVETAFRECVAETRGAAGAGGLFVAMPGAPSDVEELADGSVRMSASFRASNARGDEWTRRFVCEADEGGVRFLQVD